MFWFDFILVLICYVCFAFMVFCSLSGFSLLSVWCLTGSCVVEAFQLGQLRLLFASSSALNLVSVCYQISNRRQGQLCLMGSHQPWVILTSLIDDK